MKAQNQVLRRTIAVAVALATLATIVAGSHWRLSGFADTGAIVRVAWSARPERVELCRRLSDAEMEKLPVHMRQRLECEGTTARYRLEVTRDGAVVDTGTIRGGGLRHDREVYVSREIIVAPGSARLTVHFVRLDSSTGPAAAADTAKATDTNRPVLADRSVREDEERRRRRAEAIPPVLSLDTVVTLASRSVILVTYDPLLRRLVTKAGTP